MYVTIAESAYVILCQNEFWMPSNECQSLNAEVSCKTISESKYLSVYRVVTIHRKCSEIHSRK